MRAFLNGNYSSVMDLLELVEAFYLPLVVDDQKKCKKAKSQLEKIDQQIFSIEESGQET